MFHKWDRNRILRIFWLMTFVVGCESAIIAERDAMSSYGKIDQAPIARGYVDVFASVVGPPAFAIVLVRQGQFTVIKTEPGTTVITLPAKGSYLVQCTLSTLFAASIRVLPAGPTVDGSTQFQVVTFDQSQTVTIGEATVAAVPEAADLNYYFQVWETIPNS